ncbi:nidogen-like isoform X2 [Belonocnema kinseyi]|uniref:nidogen-like isoform X2 n=1 Tax=Belonocnema kinseyi TaxID=2817044 RepID=UPI00143D5FDB|nr:nidogen-like isoform X2 [Belonocnema kinseyi]
MVVHSARFRALLGALVVFAPLTLALSKNDLYPYATGSNTLTIDPSGQLVSSEAILKTPIVFYDKVYNAIFVNGNGVLSFGRSMSRFFNIAFPLDDPVIAPLYTHVDTRASGTIYWSETNAPEILARAGGTVRSSFKNAFQFQPTHVFLVTWIDVGYYNQKNDKINTYQAAISSNGTHSYVELLYPQDGIQWIQGESHPNGLPDAKAQVGFMSEGTIYALPGSGTDQIQNIDKLSNINRPGHWIFQVGPIPEGENVNIPDNVESSSNQPNTCRTGATTCHSKASCVDYEAGFCCQCREGHFGNGKYCQPTDVPLRVIGRMSGSINGESFEEKDLQCYVQTKDGRTYTAISRVPEVVGPSFQLLINLGSVIGWLFAKPIGETKNGFQLTGGVFNHTAELRFASTGEEITIRSIYMGQDVFGQLKVDVDVKGSIPRLADGDRIEFTDFDELLTRVQQGTIRSNSEKSYKLIGSSSEYKYSQDQIFSFSECPYAPTPEQDTTRLKFSRGVITYEGREGIIRYAMNSKIAPLEEEDPCIQGKSTCGEHSSCVVDGDEFKCVCNPGYQYIYKDENTAICVDINECTAGNHVCSPDALCVNNEGSHTCHCKPGYQGDGRVCDKSPTCDETRCLDNEQCKMISGLPVCTCLPGYESVDQICTPISQSTSCNVENNCSPFGLCSYDGNRQIHVCTCQPGYTGNGYDCYPDSEDPEKPQPQCMLGVCLCPIGWSYRDEECIKQADNTGSTSSDISCNVVNRCHPYASCVYDTINSEYACQCNSDYDGDGIECTKREISCQDVDICDPNASCRNDDTFARCVCNPGFKGDGSECKPIDDCDDHTDCGSNERCQYNPAISRYECSCVPGYSKVDSQCVLSDCSTNPSLCHVNAQCATSNEGGFKCVCVSGYRGDGINQCLEEHIGCNVVNNCGRNSVCGFNQTSSKYTCVCQPGFYGDGFTCLPQSSCKRDPGICSQFSTCVSAGNNQFTCACNDGYTGDGTNCRPTPSHEANFLLVNQGMAIHRIPFFPSRDRPGSPIVVEYEQMTIAIDIDCTRGKAYTSDVNGNRIVSLNYNGTKLESFITGVASPEGIAIDWVSRNLFWADSGKSTVEVVNLETKKRKVLIKTGLVNPRGIAVHPYRGKIFWSDWNRQAPKLEWANEDGTGRQIFIQGENVKVPNALAIDWGTDELCWADAGTFTISCAQIDTRYVHVVAESLVYPFGVAISQNHYYWTDWKTHKIEVSLKNAGQRREPLNIPAGGSGKLYGIVAVPEACPRVSNVCQYENGRCSTEQLCLPDGQGGRSCVCADNAVGPCTDSRYHQS